MASLGNAYVNIIADAKKLKPGLDKAKSSTIAAGKAMTKALAIAVPAATIASLYALHKVMQKGIELAKEQESVEVRLGAVIKATGNAAGINLEEMKGMAAAMQQVTTVGDEVIMSGMAILSTFKQVKGEAFERTTMAALDLSEVMGQDLRTSMVMLGKVMNDPVANMGALSRAGIQFTKDQKEMIKTMWEAGDVMGAQNVLLKEIESQFGGTAKAAANTYGGAVKQAANAMGDLYEEIGFMITKNEAWIQIQKDLKTTIEDATKWLKSNQDVIREWSTRVAEFIKDVGERIKDVAENILKWYQANEKFIKVKVAEYIEKMKGALEKIWTVISYDPAILEWGLVGLVIFGKKGAVILGSMAHIATVAENLSKAMGLAASGIIDYSDIAKANFKELEEILAKTEKRMIDMQAGGQTFKIGPSTEGYNEVYAPAPYVDSWMPTTDDGGPPGGDNTEADAERLALLNEQFYASQQERLGLLAGIQEQELIQNLEHENAKIELEKQMLGMSIMQATEAAQAKLNNYIAYSNAEIKAEAEKEKFKKKLARAGFNQALNDASFFFQQMGQQSKGAFEIFKGIEIAKTIISTIEGAQLAFAAGMATGGPWAPVLAAAYAASAIAAGYARVQSIMSQTPDGGGGMPGGGGSVGTYTVSPSTGLPTTGVTDYNTMPEEEEKRGTLTINIHGDFIGDESYIDMLVEKINDADDRDVFINQTNYARDLS